MRFLLLNQAFHPDVAATAQYLSDVARGLAQRGHEVNVIASRRAYDDPRTTFPPGETWEGVEIHRVRATHFGKGSKLRRAADFASFMVACFIQLLRTRRPDVVVALTSPPLISAIAAGYAALRRCRFVYWVMDLNPDEALVAGWLREGSLAARVLNALSLFSLRRADAIVVLDRFMEQRIRAKGIPAAKLFVIPPWSHDDVVRFDDAGRENFRRAHGLADKFVVMYSGNHSPCHPLNALLAAAEELRHDATLAFSFVGGGSEFAKVRQFAAARGLSNIVCLPYQPRSGLAASLSAADLHVVVMGDPFVGTIHPCKIYNVLRVAPAVLYIGPGESHITEILQGSTAPVFASVRNGDTKSIVEAIRSMRNLPADRAAFAFLADSFSANRLLPKLIATLEAAGCARGSVVVAERAAIRSD